MFPLALVLGFSLASLGQACDTAGCLSSGDLYMLPGESACLVSPNYPNTYPSRKRAFTTIRGSDDVTGFRVRNELMNMEPHNACRRDYLWIYGRTAAEEDYGKFCGTSPFAEFVTVTNRLTLRFQSNRRRNYGGYIIYVDALGDAPTTTPAPTTTQQPGGGPTNPPASGNVHSASCATCGLKKPGTRIVGGSAAQANEYPWLVGLSYHWQTGTWCGASLFSDSWVITASHCVNGDTAGDVAAKMGMHDRSQSSSAGGYVSVILSQIIMHPNYDGSTLDNDIALLKLSSSVTLSSTIMPVCLPPNGAEYVGQDAVVTGWGTLTSGGSAPNVNHAVTLPIRTQQECVDSYPEETITNNMFCAGLPGGGVDSCQGDSGGPLTVDDNGNHVLAGIVSWGYGCAWSGRYGVYAKTSMYVDNFIVPNTGTCASPSRSLDGAGVVKSPTHSAQEMAQMIVDKEQAINNAAGRPKKGQ